MRSFGGVGHEQLVQLQLRLDKFETMMVSHIEMRNEQKDVLKKTLKFRYKTFINECEKMKSR